MQISRKTLTSVGSALIHPSRKALFGVGTVLLLFLFYHGNSKTARTPGSVIHSKHSGSLTGAESSCPENNPAPQVVRQSYSRAHKIANFLEGPGLAEWHHENVTDATCKFRIDWNRTSLHLPHTMQQLYRCFAWWHANPNKRPYLLSPPFEVQTPFTVGFLEMLQTVFNLHLITKRDGRRAVRPIVNFGFDATDFHGGYKMRSPVDFDYMRQRASVHYQFPAARCNISSAQLAATALPTITILNRAPRSGRHLRQAETLKSLLETELQLNVQLVNSFDGTTFVDQIRTMWLTDILITPHGAQMVSLPFMPPCAQVIELFPVGYLVPKFYGSLAAGSGHNYSYVYTGMDLNKESLMHTLDQRRAARAQDVCLPPSAMTDSVLPALQNIVEEWKTCCRRRVPKPQQTPSPKL